ncbi:hypothetical protein MTR72_24330 [Bradyrhizobium sp. ISRA442]|uniref:hypothetical protein n=1 Tax=Bradyrhizobium sp. ISRA442 TaxID=2866197 RepID=UPI00311AF700
MPSTFEFCLPSRATSVPSGPDWLHEIKYDKATPAEHMGRVRAQGDFRPMAADKAAMDELITILQSRDDFYAGARVTLDTSDATVKDYATRLLRIIRCYCVSGCPWQSRNRSFNPT